MKRYTLYALAAVACLVAFQAFGASSRKQLTIIHVNDSHSHVEPVRDVEGQCGGVIERAAYVDSVRKADGKRNVLLLHAGDFSQGSSYFTKFNGDIEISLLNDLGYDVVTLGNHEFDNGLEEIARRLRSFKGKVVCCNYDFSPFELGKYVKPYTIVRRGGMKIGIIGVLTDISRVVAKDVADRIPSKDAVTEINRWADYLKNGEKCDLVIVLSHLGFTSKGLSDMTLVPQTSNVDLVVGGHSHTFLKKIESTKNKDGEKIPIVQAGRWGIYMGEIKVKL